MKLLIIAIAVCICGVIQVIDCIAHRSEGRNYLTPVSLILIGYAFYVMSTGFK